MKTEKRTFLTVSLVVALVLVPMVSSGQGEISGPPATPLTGQTSANNPAVGQPLIPEGVFAVQLAEALKVGQTQDEAQAESMLSAVGIEPKNGWIAGYPVTPPMIGEIEKGVAGAADAGKLSLGKEQAMKALGDLKNKLGLNVNSQAPPGGKTVAAPPSNVIYKYTDKEGFLHFTNQYESIPQEYRNQVEVIKETAPPSSYGGPAPAGEDTQMSNYAANPDPEVINNYYYDEGPPVVTYYPPPDPYYYLYGWVPYPFWYSGGFFRGFFILHDFHRRVFFGGHPFFVTNHVGHAGSHRTSIVDPVSRSLRGSMGPNRFTSSHGFGSPQAQSSARTIVGLSQNRMTSAPGSTAPRMIHTTSSGSMGGLQKPGSLNPGTFSGRGSSPSRSNFGPPRVSQGRSFSPPAYSGRAFSSASPRVFSSPSYSRGRSFSAPSYSGGSSFGGYHGGGSSLGGSHGGGGGIRGGGGGSHGSGGSRGHR
jgi:hypothetical protein